MPFKNLFHGYARATMRQEITRYLVQAPWFRSFVRTTQDATVSSTSSKMGKFIQMAKEEISKDFGAGKKP